MNEQRNMILAVVLSVLVLLGWGLLSDKLVPTASEQSQKVEDGKVVPAPQPQPQAGPVAQAPAKIRPRELVIAESPRVQIRTPSLQGSINLKGARLDDLVLLKERQTIAKNSPPVRLLSPAGAPGA